MQLLIIKDLVVVVDSYEGLPMRKITAEIVFVFCFFFTAKDKSSVCGDEMSLVRPVFITFIFVCLFSDMSIEVNDLGPGIY